MGMIKIIFMMGLINIMIMGIVKFLSTLYSNLMFICRLFIVFMYLDIGGIWVNLIIGYWGVDRYSFFLIVLRIWVVGLIFMTLGKFKLIKFVIFILLLLCFLIYFLSLRLMIFYLFFEISLIPTFFLVVYWGVNPERLRAGFYLIIYTLFISLPLMVYIFWWFNFLGSFRIILSRYWLVRYNLIFIDYIVIFRAFYIKLPIYLFHVWLPKAHVEAPVYGSMVLAAVLLKLGTYGLVRIMMIFVYRCIKYNWIIFRVSIVGRIFIRILCLVQVDLKRLVAYSSVVHINFLLCSILSIFKIGFLRSYIIMIGHGLCSSGLFYMVNIYYSKTGSRILFLNKGIIGLIPTYVVWWFFLCSANFSFPLSINFISEVLIIGVVIRWEVRMIVFLGIIRFFRRVYSLYLYSYIQYGSVYLEEKFDCGLLKDYLVLIIHLYPLVFMLINMIIFY